jgi:hypothetical protein
LQHQDCRYDLKRKSEGKYRLVRDAERIVAQRVAAEQRKAVEQVVEQAVERKRSQAPKIDFTDTQPRP